VDVSKARSLLAEHGRQAHLVSSEALEELLAVNASRVVVGHIPHAGLSPGIIGQLYGGIFLIDGTYRALRSQREKIPFYAFLLTFDETMACMVDEPAVTPARATQEIREMLRNNPGPINADVSLSGELRGANLPKRMEEAIRASLTAEENSRLRLVFHHQGKTIPANKEHKHDGKEAIPE